MKKIFRSRVWAVCLFGIIFLTTTLLLFSSTDKYSHIYAVKIKNAECITNKPLVKKSGLIYTRHFRNNGTEKTYLELKYSRYKIQTDTTSATLLIDQTIFKKELRKELEIDPKKTIFYYSYESLKAELPETITFQHEKEIPEENLTRYPMDKYIKECKKENKDVIIFCHTIVGKHHKTGQFYSFHASGILYILPNVEASFDIDANHDGKITDADKENNLKNIHPGRILIQMPSGKENNSDYSDYQSPISLDLTKNESTHEFQLDIPALFGHTSPNTQLKFKGGKKYDFKIYAKRGTTRTARVKLTTKMVTFKNFNIKSPLTPSTDLLDSALVSNVSVKFNVAEDDGFAIDDGLELTHPTPPKENKYYNKPIVTMLVPTQNHTPLLMEILPDDPAIERFLTGEAENPSIAKWEKHKLHGLSAPPIHPNETLVNIVLKRKDNDGKIINEDPVHFQIPPDLIRAFVVKQKISPPIHIVCLSDSPQNKSSAFPHASAIKDFYEKHGISLQTTSLPRIEYPFSPTFSLDTDRKFFTKKYKESNALTMVILYNGVSFADVNTKHAYDGMAYPYNRIAFIRQNGREIETFAHELAHLLSDLWDVESGDSKGIMSYSNQKNLDNCIFRYYPAFSFEGTNHSKEEDRKQWDDLHSQIKN